MTACTLRAIAIWIAFFAVLPASLIAQTVPDSRGREFYLTFPPNIHELEGINRDSLFIFIAATRPTSGNIAYRTVNGTPLNRAFTISDVSKVYKLALHWRSIELVSEYNREAGSQSQNGKVARQSFHITADQDIAVYAMNHSAQSSDAMMALPTDVLGTEYLVLGYNSNWRGNEDASTPSQFAVVATADNTDVTITPSASVLNGRTTPISVRLNSGESYLLQADVSRALSYSDLTGTRITSTKPVAVFAGHQRSLVPARSTSLISRDYLLEQMPPINTWGRRHILTPFPSPPNLSKKESDIYRVLAANNGTDVMINNTRVATLQAGQVYEAALLEAAVVEASKDVLVAQYKRSSNESGNITRISDPFMLVVPPVRQYLSSYLCINAQAYSGGVVYEQQYITIICPTSFINTVTIDSKAVAPALFFPVPTSCYSYAIVPVSDGVHKVEAATEVGIYLYGYGVADSYGYVGGMAFRDYAGEGGRVAFAIAPESMHAAPGDTISLDIHASSAEWNDIVARTFKMELSYKLSWMGYTGKIVRGSALDSTWSLEVREVDGNTPDTKKTIIMANGTTPVARDGTIATLRMLLFMDNDTLYSPSLSATANNDLNCVESTAASLDIGLSQCVIKLSPIRYSGKTYSLRSDISADGVLHIRYGVGITAETRIELFNSLGEHIRTINASVQQPGDYEEEIPISQLSSGAYFIRMNSGPYTYTLPVLVAPR